MKQIIILIAAGVFSMNGVAQDASYTTASSDVELRESNIKYCAKLQDGKIVVMQEKRDLTIDVTLANGTVIQTDGTVLRKDGTKFVLKNGECVDNNGNLLSKEQKKKEEPAIIPK